MGLERLMLEASGFDFRSRHPQKLVIKLAKMCKYDRETTAKRAYNISIDLYRTLAPLKQTASTLAIACVELAARTSEADLDVLSEKGRLNYSNWASSRPEVMGEFTAVTKLPVKPNLSD
jgi:CTD kinase subunit beta